MSADNTQGAPAPSPAPAAPAAAPVDGPREIVLGAPNSNQSVTDVEAKTDKPAAAPAPKADDDHLDDEGTDGNGVDRRAPRKQGVQDRIDELTRARREAEREAEYWKTRAGGADKAQPPAQPAASKPPVREDYQSDEEFADAKVDYRVDQKLAKRDSTAKVQEELTGKVTEWQSRTDAERATTPDYNKVMDACDTPVALHIADLLMEHEDGAKLAYQLAKTPAEIERLNKLPPVKAAFEIAKIAAKLSSSGSVVSADSGAPSKVSTAPSPVVPLGQGRATTPKLGDLPMEDYIAERKKQGAHY